MSKRTPLPTNVSNLNTLDLKRKIPVTDAAELNSMHPDTFRKHYGHLIIRASPRCDRVELGDAIALPPPPR
jgi:hypothetical protein